MGIVRFSILLLLLSQYCWDGRGVYGAKTGRREILCGLLEDHTSWKALIAEIIF